MFLISFPCERKEKLASPFCVIILHIYICVHVCVVMGAGLWGYCCLSESQQWVAPGLAEQARCLKAFLVMTAGCLA